MDSEISVRQRSEVASGLLETQVGQLVRDIADKKESKSEAMKHAFEDVQDGASSMSERKEPDALMERKRVMPCNTISHSAGRASGEAGSMNHRWMEDRFCTMEGKMMVHMAHFRIILRDVLPYKVFVHR